jgi:molecular chaperone GrpE
MVPYDPADGTDDAPELDIELDAALLDQALQSLEAEGLFLEEGGSKRRPPEAEPAAVAAAAVAPATVAPAATAVEPAPPRPTPREDELTARLEDTRDELERARGETRRLTEQQADVQRQLREAREAARERGAEFDRLRARSRKDVEEAERRGEERALRALLEIFDNVERANFHEASDPGRLASGLHMLTEQFRRQLARVGLERVPAGRGAAFDPEIHEAVAHIDDDGVPEGAVVSEVAAGFRLRGRLFRPARVTVATRLTFEPTGN